MPLLLLLMPMLVLVSLVPVPVLLVLPLLPVLLPPTQLVDVQPQQLAHVDECGSQQTASARAATAVAVVAAAAAALRRRWQAPGHALPLLRLRASAAT